jgi:hypothetical protein
VSPRARAFRYQRAYRRAADACCRGGDAGSAANGRRAAVGGGTLTSVEGISANPPTKEEVERARAQLLKGIELALNNSGQVGLTLSEFIGAGDWRLFFLHRDRLRKITSEHHQVRRLRQVRSGPGEVAFTRRETRRVINQKYESRRLP